MTIIYMDDKVRLKKPTNESQKNDWECWYSGTKIGEIIDTELNPIIFSN